MKIGCTSYCIPGTYGENIRFIAGDDRFNAVSHIQLLCYFWDDGVRDLLRSERDVIMAHRHRFTYSVHLPDIVIADHARIIHETGGYSLHYDLHPQERVEDEIFESLQPLTEAAGGIGRFFLENLIGRDMGPTERIMERMGSPADESGISLPPALCVDIGHLLMTGVDPANYCEARNGRIREIHLHGVKDGADHRSFGAKERWFLRMVPFLSLFEGLAVLEVFSVEETIEIIDGLRFHGLIASS